VRVLLDEQLPRKLVRELVGHEVSTVQREGWAGVENGQLLWLAAEAGFDVFVTKDQSLEFQQNLSSARLGVIFLDAPSHDIDVLRPLVPATLVAIEQIRAGEVRHVAL
jgi:hypothetical protein